jgi:hypothetical protein
VGKRKEVRSSNYKNLSENIISILQEEETKNLNEYATAVGRRVLKTTLIDNKENNTQKNGKAYMQIFLK